MADLPLADVRILAVSQVGAGPWALSLLSDLGADVVKVEAPGVGDEARHYPPFASGGDSIYFQALNRGCRAITIDLRDPRGQEVLRRIVPRCDVVYNNLRGGQPSRLGLTYKALSAVHPGVVCCSLSGFGQTGPRASEPGYDFLIQAYAGFMALTGEPEGPPARSGVSVVDFSAGLVSVLALLIGLRTAQSTGRGAEIDVSLYDTALSMLNYLASWNLSRGVRPERMAASAHQSLVPVQTFATADGHIVVMCMKQKFWRRLCEVLACPQWTSDPRFATFEDRAENRAELVALLEKKFLSRTTEEWIQTMRGVVPCGPVHDLDEALADEHAEARGMIVSVDHPVFGSLTQMANPIKIAGVDPQYRRAAALGEHTDEVLTELGDFSEKELRMLREVGVI